MTGNNRNFILAIVLSILVLVGWQYFVAQPQIDRARDAQEASQQIAQGDLPQPLPGGPAEIQTPAAEPSAQVVVSREDALALTARVPIRSGSLTGSINLRGGRIDDLSLNEYREEVEPDSPIVVLLSPATGPQGYFAEYGWTGPAGLAVPGPATEWTAPAGATLSPGNPVTLTWDNGAGLVFRRTVSVDEHYLFSFADTVENTTAAPVNLTPYGRITRFGQPLATGYFILHEGMIGVIGDEGLEEVDYSDLEDVPVTEYEPATQGWLGITDKYWATALIPTPGTEYRGRFVRFTDTEGGGLRYQADFSGAAVAVPAGGTAEVTNRLFAGAKEVAVINGYRDTLGIDRFDLVIDWGWFYFITKPMFFMLDWFFELLGNFGLAILAVTVLVKIVFFPLANRSYRSMSAMRKVQPQLMALRERFKDDRVKQQQAMMELYKKEKVNPVAGCWPILLQVPVFFALYKVLFVTIEMRHAPFFGWIQDLSWMDEGIPRADGTATSLFNLFGLLPYDVPAFLVIGIWPVIMGITMWVQMRLNPAPPDRTQQMIFNWMPVVFTFMLASFPAGLVIYWAWNNLLSVIQQWVIMRRSGVQVDLLGNIAASFRRKPKAAAVPAGSDSSKPGDAKS